MIVKSTGSGARAVFECWAYLFLCELGYVTKQTLVYSTVKQVKLPYIDTIEIRVVAGIMPDT